MKKNRILSFLAAGLLLLTGACSDDPIAKGGATDDESKIVDPTESVYFTVNFDLPSAKSTRSYTNGNNTSNSGTEIGQDFENTVKCALVVLTDPSNAFIASGLAQKESIIQVTASGRTYQATAKFSKTDLAQYYNDDENNTNPDSNVPHDINVYVFCNPPHSLLDYFTSQEPEAIPSNWANLVGYYKETPTSVNALLGEVNQLGINTGMGPEFGTGTVNFDPSIYTDENANETKTIWEKDYFLMSNVSVAHRLIPGSIDAWDDFSTEANPFNLSGMNNFGRPNQIDNLTDKGVIDVERVAARYDFRDGALDGIGNPDKTYNGCDPQTYNVVLDSDGKPFVDVFLGKMFLVNMNQKFYYLPWVSNNGRMVATTSQGLENNVMLCGPELPWYSNAAGADIPGKDGNYVVDAEWSWKYSGSDELKKNDYDAHFNFPFFDNNGKMDNVDAGNNRWQSTLISDFLKTEANDNPNNWNAAEGKSKYTRWRYLTEGTIPGINSQKNGVSNGIVFKGLIKPAKDRKPLNTDDHFTKLLLNSLAQNKENVGGTSSSSSTSKPSDPIIYQFGGHLYCTWDHIRRMAIALSITDLKYNNGKWECTIDRRTRIYYAVFGTYGFGEINFNADPAYFTGEDSKNYLDKADFLAVNGQYTLVDTQNEYNPKEDEGKEPPANYLYYQWNPDNKVETNEEFGPLFDAFQKKAVENQITLYQDSFDGDLGGWGYYCYYFYWNRHNDNGQVGVMGPMEFAVVRNNVYKLAVTKISKLGHPRISANDPDAPTPNTPDEKADVYLTVTCTTLPWVVRENSIEF